MPLGKTTIENFEPADVSEVEALTLALKNMQNEKQALHDQRVATFNILEDIDEAQNKLVTANKQLKLRRFELEALKSLSNDLTGVLDVSQAIDTINQYIWEVTSYDVASYLVYQSMEGTFDFRAYLKVSVSKNFLGAIREELVGTLFQRGGIGIASSARDFGKKETLPDIVGVKLNEKGPAVPASGFTILLRVGDEVFGAINLSSTKSGIYIQPNEENIVNAMIATASVSIQRLQTLVQSQHSRTESLVESLSNGVIMFNQDKRIVLTNPMAMRMTGLPKEGYYLDKLTDLFSDFDINALIDEALSKEKTVRVKEVNLIQYFYELLIVPVKNYKKEVVGGAIILHDITKMKEIDRMKTEFVSVASHQLRTPLTAIKLFTEMLADGDTGKMNKKQKEYISDIAESTERMIKLVNDLLNVSRIETGRLRIDPEPVVMKQFIQGIIDEVMPLADNHNCKIVFKSPRGKMYPANIDKSLMRQVVHNLLTNAVRYSGQGGKGKECGDIVVTLTVDSENYVIAVKDNGIGIPKEAQERIFDKFFRADNATKTEAEGSGLGMYVAKMIVEASEGKIWFESKGDGSGTTFYVTIPVKGMKMKEGEKGLAD